MSSNADPTAAAVPSCFYTGTLDTKCMKLPKFTKPKCNTNPANGAEDDEDYEDDQDLGDEEPQDDVADAGDPEDDIQEDYASTDRPSGFNNPALEAVVGAPNLVTREFTLPFYSTVGELRKGVVVKLDESFMKQLLQQKSYKANRNGQEKRRGNVARMFLVNITQSSYEKSIGDPVFMTLVGLCKPRTRTVIDGKFSRVSTVLTSAGERDVLIAGRRKLSGLAVVQSQLGVDHEKLKTQYKARDLPGENEATTAWVHESSELFDLATRHAEHYGVTSDFGEDVTLPQPGHYILPTKLITKIIADTADANAAFKPDDLSSLQIKYQVDSNCTLPDTERVSVVQRLSIAALWADPSDYRASRM